LAVVAPPSVDLFVYPDGSLDVWGPHMIRDPYVIPRPLVQDSVVVITSDASASGGAFFVGRPWDEPSQVKVYAWLWSPAQSVATSNFRECTAVNRAQHILRTTLASKWIVHYTDNATAVSMLYSLSSPAHTIANIAKEVRNRLN